MAARGDEQGGQLHAAHHHARLHRTPATSACWSTEQGVAAREKAIGNGGLLHGRELAQVFAALRANDLIWPYVVNGYLKGKAPPAFDLLYWNGDDSNLPGPMYCWYLRNIYLENRLREPGGTVQCGVPVDLGKIDPAGLRLRVARGPHRAVAGRLREHAGARRRPLRARRQRPHRRRHQSAGEEEAQLLDRATRRRPPTPGSTRRESVPGSWWPTGASGSASTPAARSPRRRRRATPQHPAIEPAPGRYVKEKAV